VDDPQSITSDIGSGIVIGEESPLGLDRKNHAILSGRRVLIVDDDEDALELLAHMFRNVKADVITALSAQAALAELERGTVDVIISDIGMPEIDGYQLMRKIRERGSDAGGRVPAIALTAYAGEADKKEALNAGFDRHIAKPVEPTELLAAVAELVAVD
jgi:CheY-like chemotaxis protein